MKKIITTIKDILLALLLIAIIGGLGFVGGWFAYEHKIKNEKETVKMVENEDDTDIQLPFETEKRVVTKGEIEIKLDECAELSTYDGNYQVDDYMVSDVRSVEHQIMDKDIKWDIIGTTNSISISCQGVVKVGYDVKEIVVDISEDTIYIKLPKPTINDNYIIWDTVECTEKNNILNPIDFSQYKELIGQIEEDGLKQAEENGIYEKAEENMKKLVSGFLSEFNDYTVEFI